MENVSCTYSGPASATNGDTLYNGISGVSNTTPIRITTSGTAPLSNGDTVVIDQVTGDLAANGTFKIGNVSKTTFDLFDAATGTIPVAPSGAYGQWRQVELSPSSLHRLGSRSHEGILSGDGRRCAGHLPGDARFGEWRGPQQDDRRKVPRLAARPAGVGRLLLAADLTDANGHRCPPAPITSRSSESPR